MTDEEFRAWLAAPMPLDQLLRMELDEGRFQAELAQHLADVAECGRLREVFSRPRPTFATLCERRGEVERAARARAHEARIRATPPVEIGDRYPWLPDQLAS